MDSSHNGGHIGSAGFCEYGLLEGLYRIDRKMHKHVGLRVRGEVLRPYGGQRRVRRAMGTLCPGSLQNLELT